MGMGLSFLKGSFSSQQLEQIELPELGVPVPGRVGNLHKFIPGALQGFLLEMWGVQHLFQVWSLQEGMSVGNEPWDPSWSCASIPGSK